MAKSKSRERSRGTSTSKSKRPQRKAGKNAPIVSSPLIEARDSKIHGKGVYAVAPIKKGTRIIEYLGERISHAEADRRYEEKGMDDGHTFLFIASNRTVIDAGVNGNDARFINHSCDPNCETVIEGSRVFIDAIRDIKPGEELGYDYQLTWESTDDPADLALYACRCGAKNCRGTMLDPEPIDKKKKKKATKKKQRKQAQRKTKRAKRKS
jgi:SET domain-containing protein